MYLMCKMVYVILFNFGENRCIYPRLLVRVHVYSCFVSRGMNQFYINFHIYLPHRMYWATITFFFLQHTSIIRHEGWEARVGFPRYGKGAEQGFYTSMYFGHIRLYSKIVVYTRIYSDEHENQVAALFCVFLQCLNVLVKQIMYRHIHAGTT